LYSHIYAQDKKRDTGEIQDFHSEFVDYTAKGRRDPFIPLIVEPEIKSKKFFDLSEFKLIGILWRNSEYYAVIGFPDGKFYNLKENSRLGIYDAYVYKITKDSIIIREHIKIKKGAIKTKDTILKLRKEEEG
jgi:Tfp pilus assembly protein PilP